MPTEEPEPLGAPAGVPVNSRFEASDGIIEALTQSMKQLQEMQLKAFQKDDVSSTTLCRTYPLVLGIGGRRSSATPLERLQTGSPHTPKHGARCGTALTATSASAHLGPRKRASVADTRRGARTRAVPTPASAHLRPRKRASVADTPRGLRQTGTLI